MRIQTTAWAFALSAGAAVVTAGAAEPKPEPKILEAPGVGGLEGMYVEIVVLPPNLGGTKFHPFRFFPNGVFTRDVGVEATIREFDFAAEQKKRPDYWGIYTIADGRATLTYTAERTRSFKVEKIDEKWKIGALRPLHAYPDGHTFDGRFLAVGSVGEGKATGTHSTVRHFRPDGTLTENSEKVISVVGGRTMVERSPEVRGTYAVKDWTLLVTLNGETKTELLYALGKDHLGASPAVMVSNRLHWKLVK